VGAKIIKPMVQKSHDWLKALTFFFLKILKIKRWGVPLPHGPKNSCLVKNKLHFFFPSMIHVDITWLIIYVKHICCQSLLEMVAYFDIEYDQWN
jgi:hypothetical protein